MKPRRVLPPRTSADGKPMPPAAPQDHTQLLKLAGVGVFAVVMFSIVYALNADINPSPAREAARKAAQEKAQADLKAISEKNRDLRYEREAKEYEAQKAAALRDALERIRQR